MASSFERTLRSLEQTRAQPLGFALALALLAAWSVWLFGARVHVYASSREARLEVSRAMTRVAAPVGGRVIALSLELGREVREQDVLVELDSSAEQRRRAQLEAELAGLQAQLAALGARIEAEEQVRDSRRRVNAIESERARLAARDAKRAAGHEALLADVALQLHERDIVSSLQAERAQRALAERSSQARAAEEELRRLGAARHHEDDVARARIAELRGEGVELESRVQSVRAQLAASDAEIERRRIRAPAPGRLGSAAPIRVGDLLAEGDAIATVIPEEDVHVVGSFAASAALGRIVAGQPARVRLAGFSWTDYGSLQASVQRVASEPIAGEVRVELALEPQALRGVPLQHGLPGSVEIQVEAVTPWSLLLRMVGGALAAPSGGEGAAPAPAGARAARP